MSDMKDKMLPYCHAARFFLGLFILLLGGGAGCSSEEKPNPNYITNSDEQKELPTKQKRPDGVDVFRLTGENISIHLPKGFKQSLRAQIKQDIPAMKTDPLLMAPLQGGIDDLRSEDDFPDLFVDTLSDYRFVLVHNFGPLELDKEVQGAIEKYLAKRMNFLQTLMRFVQVERQSIDYTETETGNRFKVRYRILDKEDPSHQIWLTMYFIATQNQSFYILLASKTEDDLEPYLVDLVMAEPEE